MTDELVHLQADRGIATITLDSPANRNALSAQLVDELEGHLRSALEDSSVRAVHLTATGTVFCAGADLKAGGQAATARLPGILAVMMASPTPVVAELNGAVRAGASGSSPRVISPWPRSGLRSRSPRFASVCSRPSSPCPWSGGWRPAPCSRWFLTGSTFGAEEAAAAGLISLAVPDDEVRAVTDGVLDALRLAAPGALAAIKPLIAGVESRSVSDGLAWSAALSAERFGSEEAAEGMAAFRERRPPRWAPPAVESCP